MFHRLKSVRNLNNYILEIDFENNIIKYYDVSNLFEKWSIFKKLKKTKGLFNQVNESTLLDKKLIIWVHFYVQMLKLKTLDFPSFFSDFLLKWLANFSLV